MKDFIKITIGLLLLVLYVVGLWFIGSRIGVDLLVVLWNSSMHWEAIITGIIVWEWLIAAVLKLTIGILKVIKEVM